MSKLKQCFKNKFMANIRVIKDKVKSEVLKIEADLNIGAKGMAKAMGVTEQTYRQKKSDKSDRHSFNEQNLTDLKKYLKNYVENTCT